MDFVNLHFNRKLTRTNFHPHILDIFPFKNNRYKFS
jgi:hypothetical protein